MFDYTSELYYCHDHESIGAAHQAVLRSISFLYYCLFLKFYTSIKVDFGRTQSGDFSVASTQAKRVLHTPAKVKLGKNLMLWLAGQQLDYIRH